ncbi:MAG TPA: phosphoribosylglycinamide formyltransferase [Oligoflexia bacterium]|nr:phosphoribosylglycinamide formyltransferase [Oligoflexia bacterium]
MSAIPRVAVFASGGGSNFKALIEHQKTGKLRAQIVGLITDQPKAGALEFARAQKIANAVHAESDRKVREQNILATLQEWKPDWLVLAGFMRLLSPEFLNHFRDKIQECFRVVNIHPSLLPAFPGRDSYRQAFDHGVATTGVTVHFVSSGVDDGPIIAQAPLQILPHDTVDSLKARGLALEHIIYSATLERLWSEKWELRPTASGRRRLHWL